MSDFEIEVFAEAGCELGEGPLWHPVRHSLFWLDIEACRLLEKRFPSENDSPGRVWDLPEMASALARDNDDPEILWIVTDKSFGRFHLQSGCFEAAISLYLGDDLRANDGGVSPAGDFWFGSMEREPTGPGGAIYSISPGGKLVRQDLAVGIPNTLCWSADGSELFLSDSLIQLTHAYRVIDGKICESRRENIIDLSDGVATPDGGATDRNGRLWIAQWDGARVACYHRSGELLASIELPVPRPTSCCFGGENNEYLFVTSAKVGLEKSILADFPLSGSVFVVKMDTSGTEVPAYCSK